MFNQFRAEVRIEIEDLKVVVAELKSKVNEKEKRIEELEEKNGILLGKIDGKQKEVDKSLK